MVRLNHKTDMGKGGRAFLTLGAVMFLAACGAGPEDLESTETSSPSAQTQDGMSADATDPHFPEWRNGVTPSYGPEHRHAAPAVPIMVDGVLHPPSSISRFNGQPVIFYVTKEAQEQGYVHVFAHPRQFREYAKANDTEASAQGSVSVQNTTTPAVFYADPNLTGWDIKFAANVCDANLGDNWVNWFWNWNDQISSFTAAPSGRYSIVYEHTSYSGNSVVAQSGTSQLNLSWYNFDNKASSLCVY